MANVIEAPRKPAATIAETVNPITQSEKSLRNRLTLVSIMRGKGASTPVPEGDGAALPKKGEYSPMPPLVRPKGKNRGW